MICPRCRLSISIKEAEGHIGYTCAKCLGLWLPYKYLESIRHNYEFDAQKLLADLSNNRIATAKDAKCPSCPQQLARSRIGEIELDWCEKCIGVWFDRQELTALVTHQRQSAPVQQALVAGADTVQLIAGLIELISSS
jgi:Zn-finger nucleic acid-binding protein